MHCVFSYKPLQIFQEKVSRKNNYSNPFLQEIDALLAVSTNQLTSARTFYEMARARLREEEEDSD